MTTNWLPGIITLGAGLAAGAIGLLAARKKDSDSSKTEELDVLQTRADKLVDPINRAELGRIDPALGGVVQQTHGCPNCGNVEFRLE